MIFRIFYIGFSEANILKRMLQNLLRKTRKYRSWRRILLLSFVFVVAWLYWDARNLIFSASNMIVDVTEKCDEGFTGQFLEDLCINYTKGTVYGDMCNPLCLTKDIKISSCISHGSTLVLQGNWGIKPVVLKKKKGHSSQTVEDMLDGISPHGMALNSKRLKEDVRESLLGQLRSLLGATSVEMLSKEEKDDIFQRLLFGQSKGEVSKMTRQELVSHLAITLQDEFLMLTAFQNLNYFPSILGICGTLYGMEKVTPLDRINFNKLPWALRAKVGQDFLKMAEALEKSKAGALNHCDVQFANFGVTENLNVRALDVDLIFTDERMNGILAQPNCSSNEQCDFFDCLSFCDVRRTRCTSRKVTNNLQVLCRDIFLGQGHRFGLLEDAPRQLRQRLNSLLKFCSSQHFGVLLMSSKQVKNMIKELHLLLQPDALLRDSR